MNAPSKVEAASPHVYQAIAAVQGELATVGIAKTRKNQQPGANYMFRGIDDVYAALSPLLAKNKLVVVPRVLSRQVTERQTKNGGTLFNVVVQVEFDFVSALDGTTHTASTFGEAMDSSDKATNKAMSAAYKYAAFMTFAIPTEGDNDADATTHEVAAGTVSDAQLATLTTLLEQSGSDVRAFCDYFGVDVVKALPAARFDQAHQLLKTKVAKKQPEPVK